MRYKILTLKFALAAIILLLGGCSQERPKSRVSNDLIKLREIVNLQIPIKSARWAVFSSPEEGGFLPTSPDFTILVAELNSEDQWFDANKEPTGEIFIAPGVARPWVTAAFHRILEENKNTVVDLSGKANCRKYSTTAKESAKAVEGFVCGNADRVLLYLTLWSGM